MEFIISCSYYTRGEAVLIKYPLLMQYEHRFENCELILKVNSLEELIEISKKIHQNFIVDLDSIEMGEMELVIYDSYIE